MQMVIAGAGRSQVQMTARGADAASLALAEQARRHHRTGDLRTALRRYDEAVAIGSDDAMLWCERGSVLADLGRSELALSSYDRALSLDSELADAHDFRAIVLAQAGRMEEALDGFDRALALHPGNLNALNNRGNVLKSLGRHQEALAVHDRIVAALPGFAPGHNNRGNSLIALGRLEEAVESFGRALAIDPDQVQSHLNRAHALVKLLRREEAIESFRQALARDPAQVEALVNLGELLASLGRQEEAAHYYNLAVSQDPTNIEACVGFGDVLLALSRPDLAAACYDRALSCDADNAEALGRMGMALVELYRRDEALSCFDRALALDPGDPQIWRSRALLLMEVGDMEQSLDSHTRALGLAPSFPYQAGQRLHVAMRLSHWPDFDRTRDSLIQSVVAGERHVAPFDFLAAVDDAALQKRCAELFVGYELPHVAEMPMSRRPARSGRIRVGYFSADFREHATMRLLLETLEAHDRDRFELVAISFGRDTQDASQRRVEAAVDRFVDVRTRTDQQIASLSRDLAIDIAIDLKGYTQGNRTAIFAHRAAPVQASYLGFPGTLGMAAMDYLIADEWLVPERARQHYAEKIVYLPGSYQANCRLYDIPRIASRRDQQLPDEAFVYCCFNQNYKIVPALFDRWMAILRQVENSVLWLWANQGTARDNLRAHAAARGVDPERLVFADRLPTDAHLDRLRLADLFLDTVPCNAHTTASDALRIGLPVLTCPGASFAARVAASLLAAVDLPELIAADLDAYAALAVALGNDREWLGAIRQKLVRNRTQSSLFDPVRMARKLEAGFVAMHDRYRDGRAPDHIRV